MIKYIIQKFGIVFVDPNYISYISCAEIASYLLSNTDFIRNKLLYNENIKLKWICSAAYNGNLELIKIEDNDDSNVSCRGD